MKRSSDLQVTPVRSYSVAKYPSHADPDPTRVPYPVPYPWSSQAVAALATLGIAASCSQQPGTVTSGQMPSRDVAASRDGGGNDAAVANPFTLEASGLPYVSPDFGTGAPRYLEDDIAREVIERVFRKAGFPLKPRQQYDRNGVTFIADGYDADRHVGYVFASEENLDDDALGWQPEPGQHDLINYRLDALAYWAEQVGDTARLKEIRSVQQLPDPAKRKAAYRALLARDRPTKLSLAEAQRLISKGPSRGEFIAVISNYDARLIVPYWSEQLEAELAQAEFLPDPAKRDAAVQAAHEKAAREVVEHLEQNVRDYISWARSQGLQ